jgi:hypothetical protein
MASYAIDPSGVGGFCLVLTCEIEIELHKQNQLQLCECDRCHGTRLPPVGYANNTILLTNLLSQS